MSLKIHAKVREANTQPTTSFEVTVPIAIIRALSIEPGDTIVLDLQEVFKHKERAIG